MAQSIENIWKEGFLEKEDLIAPKVVGLYNKKSKNIVDRMMKTLRVNIYVLLLMAVGFLLYAILSEMPLYIGLFMFLIFSVPAVVSWRQMKKVELHHGTSNSYEFLVEFQHWLHLQMSKNTLLSRFIYPSSVISAGLIMWHGANRVEVMEEILQKYPDLTLIGGVPVYFAASIAIVAIIMAVFAGKIYRWDVGLIYGRQYSKLREIISDLEELRK